ELRSLLVRFPFQPKMCENAVDHRQRPSTFVQRLWIHRRRGFKRVTALGVLKLEGQQDHTAASLLGLSTGSVVCEEVLKRCKKKGAKASSLLTNIFYVASFEQRDEKPLSKIARIIRVGAVSASVRVQRVPVDLT